MRLLLVEDEDYTREGIISSIPWKDLGKDSLIQADDGINGFEISKAYKPDIVLADIRMPRMDGIEMAFKIRELLPECSIIFMSAYSDKEYLKSAIKLSAVDYIEKPLDLAELQNTIKNAVEQKRIEKNKVAGNLFPYIIDNLVDKAEKQGVWQFEDKDRHQLYDIIKEPKFIDHIEEFLKDSIYTYFSKQKAIRNRNTCRINANVEKIETLIQEEYNNPMLSLNYIAETLNFSVSYICILYKRCRGKTINQYITEYRVEKAKKYLRESKKTIKSIAQSVGFTDWNYFIKVFKKETGLTPGEYRRGRML